MTRITFYKRWLAHRRFRLALQLILILLAAVGFEEVYDDVFLDPTEGDNEAQEFDSGLHRFAQSYRSPHLTQVMTDLTALGSVSGVLTLVAIFVSVLWTYRDYKGLIYITVVSLGAGAWPWILKPMFHRARPELAGHLVHVSDLSFPSGHSFGAASVYIGLAFYAAHYARSFYHELFFYFLGAVVITLVGTSRIYLGVHYPTDVLAGLCGGTIWALTVSSVYEFFYPRGPFET